jgi:hypothetical protein
MVSAPEPPNSCIAPVPAALSAMMSFSVPPFTVPVFPACRTTMSLPLSPVMLAAPVPATS